MPPNQTLVMPNNTPPPKKKPNLFVRALKLLLILSLVAGAAALGGLYYLERQNKQKLNNELTSAKEKVVALEAQAQKPDQKGSASDDVQYFTPQCEESNEKDLYLVKLTPEPVVGHEVFLTVCQSSLTKDNVLIRTAVLKVNEDGSKDFAYGASSIEPLCFSADVLNNQEDAEILSNAAGVRLCD